MIECLSHRGPDGEGRFVDKDVPIKMGMRRLSIVDLAGGDQPMFSEDGDVVAVFNGEIYNHESLRRTLEEAGHSFETQSDTEVLVHCWEEYGTDMPTYLDGMFAFSIWDREQEELFLARDRLGIKPLYVADLEDQYVWGSEIQSLLAAGVDRRVDEQAVYNYFTLRYTPSPQTLFDSIKKLPPGWCAHVTADHANEWQYWAPSIDPVSGSTDIIAKKLREHLERSVSSRTMSDVPLGAFLSGGLDSSSIVALLSEEMDDLRTFSIGFQADSYDESSEARFVADHFGTRHEEITVDLDSMDLFGQLVRQLGEPLADPAVFPTLLLSELASDHVKVVLSGEGADELLAGYWYYKIPEDRKKYGRLPGPAFTAADLLERYGLQGKKELRYLASMRSDRDALVGLMQRFQIPPERYVETELGPETSKLDDVVDTAFDRATSDHCFDRIASFDLAYWLPDDLLYKVDQASMSNSLEARVPFLDHRLVEFVYNVPREQKQGGYKPLLKRAMRDVLPERTLERNKHGLGVPVSRWFRSDHDAIQGWLTEENIAATPFLNSDDVFDIWSTHRSGKRDYGLTLWKMLNYVAWYDTFGSRS
jgi:asparagine synthase (glutamine-hydrolysing)